MKREPPLALLVCVETSVNESARKLQRETEERLRGITQKLARESFFSLWQKTVEEYGVKLLQWTLGEFSEVIEKHRYGKPRFTLFPSFFSLVSMKKTEGQLLNSIIDSGGNQERPGFWKVESPNVGQDNLGPGLSTTDRATKINWSLTEILLKHYRFAKKARGWSCAKLRNRFRTTWSMPGGVYMSDVWGTFFMATGKSEEIMFTGVKELIVKTFWNWTSCREKSLNKAAQLLQANYAGNSTPYELVADVRKG